MKNGDALVQFGGYQRMNVKAPSMFHEIMGTVYILTTHTASWCGGVRNSHPRVKS